MLAEPRAADPVALTPDPARAPGVLAVVRAPQRPAPTERPAHANLVEERVNGRSIDPHRRHAEPRGDPRLDGLASRTPRGTVVPHDPADEKVGQGRDVGAALGLRVKGERAGPGRIRAGPHRTVL